MAEIRELNPDHIHKANYNSMSGKRGDANAGQYRQYAEKIVSWPISEEKKQKLLDKLHEKYSRLIALDAQHVPVVVAGPARYNAKKLDKSDQILAISVEISGWFDKLENELEQSKTEKKDDRTQRLVESIEFLDSRYPQTDPTGRLTELSAVNVAKFIEMYEQLYTKYKWRKNSTVAKLYAMATAGDLKAPEREEIYSNADYTAYEYRGRLFIKFMLKPQRQLITALKSRGYWWNSYENAWSTYPEKADREWIKTISEQYARYL